MKNACSNCNKIGHTIKECMFLASCPACEKSRIRGNSRQNLLIDI